MNTEDRMMDIVNSAYDAQINLEQGLYAVDKLLDEYEWDVELNPALALKYSHREEYADSKEELSAKISFKWNAEYNDIMWFLNVACKLLHEAKDILSGIQETV